MSDKKNLVAAADGQLPEEYYAWWPKVRKILDEIHAIRPAGGICQSGNGEVIGRSYTDRQVKHQNRLEVALTKLCEIDEYDDLHDFCGEVGSVTFCHACGISMLPGGDNFYRARVLSSSYYVGISVSGEEARNGKALTILHLEADEAEALGSMLIIAAKRARLEREHDRRRRELLEQREQAAGSVPPTNGNTDLHGSQKLDNPRSS